MVYRRPKRVDPVRSLVIERGERSEPCFRPTNVTKSNGSNSFKRSERRPLGSRTKENGKRPSAVSTLSSLLEPLKSKPNKMKLKHQHVLQTGARILKWLCILLLKFKLNVLYYVINTRMGYAMYCVVVSLFFFGRHNIAQADAYGRILWLVSGFIVFYVLGLSLMFYLICRLDTTKKILYQLVPYEYVVRCLGHP